MKRDTSRRRAWLWLIAGILFMTVAGLAWALVPMGYGGAPGGALGGVAAYFGARWVNQGRRLSRVALVRSSEGDEGARVLYLHFFGDDAVAVERITSGINDRSECDRSLPLFGYHSTKRVMRSPQHRGRRRTAPLQSDG